MSFKEKLADIKRFDHIVNVLTKYGFGYFLERVHLSRKNPYVKRKRFKKPHSEKSRAERFRMMLEELGPTFVKFGQILSTRHDLLPKDIVDELQKLQDQVPPFPFKDVKAIIKQETGKEVHELFKDFNSVPLASASLGQVHEAVLNTGEHIVIKVQRPRIVEMIDHDINIIKYISKLAEGHSPTARTVNPTRIVQEFDRQIRKELNYILEAQNIERFASNFEGNEAIKVPKVYWSLTTERLITMEKIDGICVRDIDKVHPKWLDKRLIAKRGIDLFLRQVFFHNFFHGDPHPGNIFVLKGNVICFLDFGIMGKIPEELSEKLVKLYLAVINKDVEGTVKGFLEVGRADEHVDIISFKEEISDALDSMYTAKEASAKLGKVVNHLIEVAVKHKIIIPRDLILLGKAFYEIDGLGETLDKDFNMMEGSRPFLKELMLKKYGPKRIASEIYANIYKIGELARTLPDRTDNILKKIEGGELKVEFEHKNLKELEQEMDSSSNRLTLGVIIGSFVIFSGLAMHLKTGPYIGSYPAFAMFGFIVAIVLLISLLGSFRKRR